MWCPVLSPVPDLPRASYLAQLLYLFLLGLPMSLVGALITLSDEVLYPFYTRAPRVWELTPLADQQLGGERSQLDRKSTRLNSSHLVISYAVFCLKKKKN